MNTGLVASFLGITALWMALVALGTGALASFLIAPIALRAREPSPWLFAGSDADDPALGRGNGPPHRPGRSRAGGRRLSRAEVSPPRCWGSGVVFTGSQLALQLDPPPSGETLPSTLSAGLNAGIALDETVKLLTQLDEALRPPRPLVEVAQDLRAAAERHLELGWVREPHRAHLTPPALEKPTSPGRESRGRGSWSISASRASTSPTIPRSATTTWRSIAIASPTPTCGDTRPDRARP